MNKKLKYGGETLIHLRIKKNEKDIIKKASRAIALNVSTFLRTTGFKEAKKILGEVKT